MTFVVAPNHKRTMTLIPQTDSPLPLLQYRTVLESFIHIYTLIPQQLSANEFIFHEQVKLTFFGPELRNRLYNITQKLPQSSFNCMKFNWDPCTYTQVIVCAPSCFSPRCRQHHHTFAVVYKLKDWRLCFWRRKNTLCSRAHQKLVLLICTQGRQDLSETKHKNTINIDAKIKTRSNNITCLCLCRKRTHNLFLFTALFFNRCRYRNKKYIDYVTSIRLFMSRFSYVHFILKRFKLV